MTGDDVDAPQDPTSGRAPTPSGRRRVASIVIAAVLAAVLGSFAVAAIAGPRSSEEPADVADAAVAACTRAGADEDDCRCAIDRLVAAGTPLGSLDEDLSTPLSLPAEVAANLEGCVEASGSR